MLRFLSCRPVRLLLPTDLLCYQTSLLIQALVFSAPQEVAPAEDGCNTPNGERGSCIVIMECQSMKDLLETVRPITPAVANILRRYQCGFQGQEAKVCCPANPIKLTQSNFGGTPKAYTNKPWCLGRFRRLRPVYASNQNFIGTYLYR